MKKIFVLIPFYLFSCKTEIIIKGEIQNLPGKKVYLTKKEDDYIIDSTIVYNNSFIFKIKRNQKFIPEYVRLKVGDSNCFQCLHPIFLYPESQIKDKQHWSRNNFYLEKGITHISGDYRANYLLFKSGIENKNYFLFDVESSLWDFENDDDKKRDDKIKLIKEIITENPNSPFLISKVWQSRIYFKDNELKEILDIFKIRILKTKNGKNLIEYYNFRKLQLKESVPNYSFQLFDNFNHLDSVVNRGAKITILNFWATWCGPCKLEIPTLIALYNKYKEQGVEFISISFDNDRKAWLNDLDNYNLQWKQFIISGVENSKYQKKFNAFMIPTTIILLKDYKKLEQYYGYNKNFEAKLDSLIKSNIY